jgi:NAD(P)H dehydrogenase (quinone)
VTFSQQRRFLVVVSHPVESSFVQAAAERVTRAVAKLGYELRVSDLYAKGFDPMLGADEWATRHDGVPESLASYVADLRWATDLVLVYPTWFGSPPAMMKGWFDRVWGKGVAWDLPSGAATPRPLLSNIARVWVVTTHGSPKWVNMVQGEGGRRFTHRTLRLTCSWRCRVKWLAFYGNDSATAADRSAYLDRVESSFS